MELIYAHIEKYRCFEEQDISFSNEFKIDYDKGNNSLSIKRNENIFPMYPANIVGVSAIVGKNATGKTSLLDLIGDQVGMKYQKNDIFFGNENGFEFRKMIKQGRLGGVSNRKNEIRYSSDYFLLYFLESDKDGNDLFVCETQRPDKYFLDFVGKADYLEVGYFQSKGWIAYKIKSANGRLEFDGIFDNDFSEFQTKATASNTSIIRFGVENRIGKLNYPGEEEESKISVMRRSYSLSPDNWYDYISFLVDTMRLPQKAGLFLDQNYSFFVRFDTYTDINIDRKKCFPDFTFSDFEEIFCNAEICVLNFLHYYMEYFFSHAFSSKKENDIVENETERELAAKLAIIEQPDNSYQSYFDNYFKRINVLYTYFNLENKKYSSSISIDNLRRSVDELYRFVCSSEENKINFTVQSDGFVLKLNKDSRIENVKTFFEYFIDERNTRKDQQPLSVIDNFLSCELQNLCDGERAYLDLFASIHKSVAKSYMNKANYILLFDEIERSFHPEMCRTLISNLVDFLGRYKNKKFQIIIATHSPFIIGDIYYGNLIRLERNGPNSTIIESKEKTFGQNIYLMLKQSFFMEKTIGDYAYKMISMVYSATQKDNLRSVIYLLRQNGFDFIYQDNTEKIVAFLDSIIKSIGEDLIRTELSECLKLAKFRTQSE